MERVVVWDAKGLWGFDDARVTFFDDFAKQGQAFLEAHPRAARPSGAPPSQPDDTAMIIYTSGTTGPPKGAMLSHRSILFMAEAAPRRTRSGPDDEGVSYLPFAHVYENLISVFCRSVPARW